MTVNNPGTIPTLHVLNLYAGLDNTARATHHILDGLVDEAAELRSEIRILSQRITTALNALPPGHEESYDTIRSILNNTHNNPR